MYDQFHDVTQQVSIEPLWRIALGTGVGLLEAVFFLENTTPETKITEISSLEHRQDGRHFTH